MVLQGSLLWGPRSSHHFSRLFVSAAGEAETRGFVPTCTHFSWLRKPGKQAGYKTSWNKRITDVVQGHRGLSNTTGSFVPVFPEPPPLRS